MQPDYEFNKDHYTTVSLNKGDGERREREKIFAKVLLQVHGTGPKACGRVQQKNSFLENHEFPSVSKSIYIDLINRLWLSNQENKPRNLSLTSDTGLS